MRLMVHENGWRKKNNECAYLSQLFSYDSNIYAIVYNIIAFDYKL